MSGPLLLSARFLPLFVTQLLGTLNDNVFKNALVVFVIFHDPSDGPSLVAAAGGVFILPHVLFSAMTGQLADRCAKSRLIRITKLFEIALMLARRWGSARSCTVLHGSPVPTSVLSSPTRRHEAAQ